MGCIGSEARLVACVAWREKAFLDTVARGGSFHPAPLETAGVKPGPGWSGWRSRTEGGGAWGASEGVNMPGWGAMGWGAMGWGAMGWGAMGAGWK